VLRAKERAPTPYHFVIFTFGFTIEYVKKFEGMLVLDIKQKLKSKIDSGHTHKKIH
jgi:hypothetical protein